MWRLSPKSRLTRCRLPKRWRWSGWRGGWIISRRSFLAANSSGWRLPAPLPTGALDSATGVRVLEALATVNREMGTTTVIITHNADIAKMAQRVLWMQDGQIVREAVNERPLAARELEW